MSQTTYVEEFSDAFQRHILAVLLKTPGAISRYRTAMSHEYFSTDVLRALAKAVFAYHDEHNHLPTEVTLVQLSRSNISSQHHGSLDGVASSIYKADTTDAEGVLAKTVEFGKYAALCNAMLKSADIVMTQRESIVERGKKVRAILDGALQVGEDLREIGTQFDDDIAGRAERYLQPEINDDVVPTRIRHLDLAIGGGLKRGQLGMIIAPPGKGKSTFLVNIGFNALTDLTHRTVVHISMEMDASEVLKKYDDRLVGGVSYIRSTKPDKLGEMMEMRINKYVTGTLFVKRYFTRSVGVTSIRAYLNMLKAHGHHPDLVIVDYADIVKPERRLGDARHEQASVYEDLRTLAGEFNCACWTASQVNRAGADKATHSLTDLAESYEKAAIVDVGLTFSQTRDEEMANHCRIHVEKCRGHQDHTIVDCEIYRSRCLIRSVALYNQGLQRIDTDYEGTAPNAPPLLVKSLQGPGGSESSATGPSKPQGFRRR